MVVDLDIKPQDIDRIIEMAWEDRTPFDAIELQFRLKENGVRKIMRRILKKIAQNETDDLGDTSTLADPSVIDSLLQK